MTASAEDIRTAKRGVRRAGLPIVAAAMASATPAHAALSLPGDVSPQYSLLAFLLLAWLIYRLAASRIRRQIQGSEDSAVDFRRARLLVVSFALLLAVTVLANLALSLRGSEQALLAQSRHNARNLAQVLERQLDVLFDAADSTLRAVARTAPARLPAGSAAFPLQSEALNAAVGAQPAVRALWRTDANGRVRAYGGAVPEQVDLGARDVFLALRGGQAGPAYGTRMTDAAGHSWIPVGYPVRDAHGRFEGALVAALPLQMDETARHLDIGRGGYLALLHNDGSVLRATSPLTDEQGQAALDRVRRPDAEGATASRQGAVAEGYRAITGRPLGVLVRLDISDAMAAWRNTAYAYIAGSLVFLALIGLLAFRLLSQLERQRTQRVRIARLNRTHAVLSGINALVVRTRTRDELMRGVCRIAVEQGAFGVAWVDEVRDEHQLLRPIAMAGDDAPFVLCDRESGVDLRDAGETGLAVQQRRSKASNELAARHDACPRKERALARGYHSMITLPLLGAGNVVAAMSLLAGPADFFDEDEIRLLDGLADDISYALDHLATLERIEYLALYDVLTGLPNRTLFIDRTTQCLDKARTQGTLCALTRLDIERFRPVNDTIGWDAGDALLRTVGERLRMALGPDALVSRIERDHFVFLLDNLRSESEAAAGVQHVLQQAFDPAFRANGTELRVAARAGVALFPVDGEDTLQLMRNAEAALARARTTADRMVFYTAAMNARVAETLAIENRLRTALERDQFVLHYQPKFHARSGRMVGLEGLIRWNDPDGGLVSPARFIPLLEETGLIIEVGEWVMQQAVRDYRRWRERGLDPPRIAVNVSARQLRDDGFAASVRNALDGYVGSGHDHGLEIEITESMLMARVESNADKLDAIRRMGVRIAIDDFGTGYSSLQYIARLPLDTLKIDRSFVIGMTRNDTDREIVASVISLAHQLHLKVVAEGVDAADQATLLRSLECDEMQGYFFSPPLPRDHVERLMQGGHTYPQARSVH